MSNNNTKIDNFYEDEYYVYATFNEPWFEYFHKKSKYLRKKNRIGQSFLLGERKNFKPET